LTTPTEGALSAAHAVESNPITVIKIGIKRFFILIPP
jgi:hypothetical protein